MDVLGSFKNYFLATKKTSIDNAVFKLHYRATVGILIVFSVLVTSRQYFGDPIDCTSQSASIERQILDQYCWTSTTFTMVVSPDKKVGVDIPHPGIDVSSKDPKIYHQFYQWVCFVLAIQAVMFYIPHYMWKIWEGGRVHSLVSIAAGDKSDAVVTYFVTNHHQHNFYFARLFVCELVNLVNVVGQMYLTNRFLGGAFMSYGVDVIGYSESADQENRTDPMVIVFPRVTKCMFHLFGPSGDIQKIDALCLLPLNIMNEKIYIFLWFYLVLLSALSGLTVVYRLLTIIAPSFRFFLLKTRARFTAREYISVIVRRFQVGDWWVLHQLGNNMESRTFAAIVADLAKTFSEKGDCTPSKSSQHSSTV